MQTINQNMESIVVVTSCCFRWHHLNGWSFSDCLHCWKNVACRRPPKVVWVVGSEMHPYLEVSVKPGPGQKHRSKLFFFCSSHENDFRYYVPLSEGMLPGQHVNMCSSSERGQTGLSLGAYIFHPMFSKTNGDFNIIGFRLPVRSTVPLF